MKIAFVGKGGSGKSSISWLAARLAAAQGMQVLAIDADYNMDLSANLGWQESSATNFLNGAETDLEKILQLGDADAWNEIGGRDQAPVFSFGKQADSFTANYAERLPSGIDLMVWGAPHEALMYGSRCAHAYMKPVKYYLPFLKTENNQLVIVDSVAGTDMVSYGLYLGVDAIVVVVEGTRQSINVYQQIKAIADELGIPAVAVLNKATGNEFHQRFKDEAGELVIAEFGIDPAFVTLDFDALNDSSRMAGQTMLKRLSSVQRGGELERLKRMKDKKQAFDNATQLQ